MTKKRAYVCLAFSIALVFCVSRVGAEGDSPVEYTLEVSANTIPLGQSPGVRLKVKNLTSQPIEHALGPSSYELRIDGPAKYPRWPFQSNRPIATLRLAPEQEIYEFGTSGYLYPQAILFDKPGTYHLRYCDHWLIDGREQKVCSNNIEVHVSGKDDDDSG